MAASLIDLRQIDVILTGASVPNGSLTMRNYGEAGTSIQLASLDENLYNENIGAFGDMLVNKSYKAQNMLLTITVLRKSADYGYLKQIVADELANNSSQFAVLVKDNNGGETFFAAQCFMKTNPAYQAGSQPDANVEFKILMPSTVYTAPTA